MTDLSTLFPRYALDRYDTGWINRSLWQNKHIGSSLTKNLDSDVDHNLNAPLSDLLVRLLISTDGTDNNSFECFATNISWSGAQHWGWTIFQVDANSVQIQTGSAGIQHVGAAGAGIEVDTEDWYYKVVITKLT